VETTTKRYFGSVDYIKAIAIVAVVLTHAGLRGSDPALTPFEKIIRQSWVGFQVPAFFLVAGFLYHQASPISLRKVAQRVLRIMIPYLVASSLAILLGFSRTLHPQTILFDFATGNTIGIYYFVFVLCLCIPFIWLFSRLPALILWAGLVGLLGYSALMAFGYLPRPIQGLFWSVRGLFFTFFLGYFLTGWLIAQHLDSFRALVIPAKKVIGPLLLMAAALYVSFKAQAIWADSASGRAFSFYKIGYTLSVTGLIVLCTHTLRIPRLVRFFSEASLTIYLYHRLFQFELLPFTSEWSIPARVLSMLLVGLLGASLVAGVGRMILGRRSRTLLGY